MEIQLGCQCGEEISDFTRGERTEINTCIACDDCGTVYAVTITALES